MTFCQQRDHWIANGWPPAFGLALMRFISGNLEPFIHLGLAAALVICAICNRQRRGLILIGAFASFCLGGFHLVRALVFENADVIVQDAARKVTKSSPVMVHPDVRMDGATAEGRRLVYRYTLPNHRYNQIDPQIWQREVLPRIREAALKERMFEAAQKMGIVFGARFFTADGVLLGEYDINGKEVALTLPTRPQLRAFTNRNGNRIEARFVRLSGDLVTIERNDGTVFTNPIGIYSDADQSYIRTAAIGISK